MFAALEKLCLVCQEADLFVHVQNIHFKWRFRSDSASQLGVQQWLDMRKTGMLVTDPEGHVEMRVTLPPNLSNAGDFMRELRWRYGLADDFKFNSFLLAYNMFRSYRSIARTSLSSYLNTTRFVTMTWYD